MDVDKIRCIATIFIYITPIIAILSYIDYRLIKEMVRDEESDIYSYNSGNDSNDRILESMLR